jgi:hypothetical protein
MNLAEPANRLHHEFVLVDFPLRVEVLDATLPAALGAEASATLSYKAGLRIADNPPIVTEPLQWQITADGGAIAGPATGQVSIVGGFAAAVTRAGVGDFALHVTVTFKWENAPLYSAERNDVIPLPGA